VIAAEAARIVLGQGIAVTLPVRGAHEGCDDLEVPLGHVADLGPEIREPEIDVQLEKLDPARSLRHTPIDGNRSVGRTTLAVVTIQFGPARVPDRDNPEEAVRLLVERGYTACEIDFEGGFWMNEDWATQFGLLATEAGIALSVHAPIPAFLGHVERDLKYRRSLGMLDHTAGLARAAGARIVVFHPGFLLGRDRDSALLAVAEQLDELYARLEAKDRLVPFGVEMMGRVRELGTAKDIFWLSARLGWVRPVIDFAHLHAVTDGGFTDETPFLDVLSTADSVLDAEAPFHIHFSDIAFANRNETKHLPYGDGTLRAEPLAYALGRFSRTATVISESPDEASSQAIRAILGRE
jgi:deoxyribonuclease-4